MSGAQKVFRVNPGASRDGLRVLALGDNPGEGTARTQWDQFRGGKGEKERDKACPDAGRHPGKPYGKSQFLKE